MKFLALAAAVLAVTNLTKTVEPAGQPDFIARTCDNWALTTRDVQDFFEHAEPMTTEEWHHAYDVMPCEYRGSIAIDGKDYRFEINGGSFGVLRGTSPVSTTYYGCKDRCARLFPFHLYGDE